MAGEAAAPGRHKGDVTFPCHGDVWRDIKEIQSIEEEIHMDTGRRMEDEFNRSVRALLSWEDVKDRIYPCLAPRRWKKVSGIRAIHKRFLDLAVYYSIRMRDTEGDMTHIWVGVPLMQAWGIDVGTLDRQATENARKDGYTIRGMEEVLGTEPMPSGMYVMTNRYSSYGAAGLLDGSMIAQFAETTGIDTYIIPSSVHELLLLPAAGVQDGKDLNGMIRDINRWGVMPDERLADNAYYYEAATGDIRPV